MMDLQAFVNLIKQAYKNLGMTNYVPIKALWQSFHLLNKKVSLPEFKILLKQLHDSEFRKYEMARGSSKFSDNKRYGILADNGLLCYFRYNEDREETTLE